MSSGAVRKFPAPNNSPYGLCENKATFEEDGIFQKFYFVSFFLFSHIHSLRVWATLIKFQLENRYQKNETGSYDLMFKNLI